MIAGNPAPQVISFFATPGATPYSVGDGLLPSDLDGSTPPPPGTPNFFVGSQDNGGPYGAPSDALNIWKFHVDFVTPANSTFTGPTTVAVAAFDSMFPCSPGSRECIPQPGTAQKIDHLGYRQRPLHRAAYRNFGTHESIVTNQSVEAAPGISGIRWWEIRTPNSTPVIFQEGTYAPGVTDGIHRWMGSIAQDRQGNMALGFSAANATLFPSVWYTGRLVGDALGTMGQGEGSFINGLGSQTSTFARWGDYTAMTVDPVDDCTFWYVNEYYPVTSATGWRLRVGSFNFPSCTLAPTHTLTVASSNPDTGILITVSPNDNSGQGNGTTQLSRTYNDGTAVTLTAPTVSEGNNFSIWSGCDSATGTICNVTMNANKTVTAVYVPTVTIEETDNTATEAGPTTGMFTVNRTGSTTAVLTVNYMVSGSATSGSDYVALAPSVVILSGQSSAQIVVTPIDDAVAESDETVVVTLAAGAYVIGVPNSATVTITDDEPTTVTIAATTPTTTEGSAMRGVVTVTRTGGSTAAPLRVNFAVGGTATAGSDYTSLPTFVNIRAGQTTATITVAASNDALVEGDETVVVTLAAGAYVLGEPNSATVTITEPSTVTIAATRATTTEGGATRGVFTVTRTGGGTAAPLRVNFTVGGTATAGSDYSSLPSFVTIRAGQTTAQTVVTPIDDAEVEVDETVVVTLAAGTYVIGAPNSATVTIKDNEPTTATR